MQKLDAAFELQLYKGKIAIKVRRIRYCVWKA